MQKDNEYSFDEIVAMLPDKRKNRSVLDKFLSSLAFISIQNSFKVVDIQQYLKIGYGDTARIIDALGRYCALGTALRVASLRRGRGI